MSDLKACPGCKRSVPDALWAHAVETGAPLRCSGCGTEFSPRETDPCEGFHGGADTSVEAFASVAPTARATQRQLALDHIRSTGGATCDEVEVAFDMPHQTASARIRELVKDGKVFDTGHRRATRTGCKARVYRVVH